MPVADAKLTDDEIAAMLQPAKGKRKQKSDPDATSPRMPEALYYFLFVLLESAIVIGVWGFMRQGPEAALKAPDSDQPITTRLAHDMWSMVDGLWSVLLAMPWIPLGVVAAAAAVFVPKTGRARKRMATWVSASIVIVFLTLIALQFSEDMARLGG